MAKINEKKLPEGFKKQSELKPAKFLSAFSIEYLSSILTIILKLKSLKETFSTPRHLENIDRILKEINQQFHANTGKIKVEELRIGLNKIEKYANMNNKNLILSLGVDIESCDSASNAFDKFFSIFHYQYAQENELCMGTAGRCVFHQTFPLIIEELICNCGVWERRFNTKNLYSIKFPVAEIVRREYVDASSYVSLQAKDILELVNLSSVKWAVDSFIPSFIRYSSKSCNKCRECGLYTHRKLFSNDPINSLVFSFEWNEENMSHYYSLQVFVSVLGVIDTNRIFKNTEGCIELIGFIATELKNPAKLKDPKRIVKIDGLWYKSSGKLFKIGEGRWFDVGLYLLLKNLYINIIFYDRGNTNSCNISPIEIAYLERLLYIYEKNPFSDILGQEIKYAIKINEVVKIDKFECLNCRNLKEFGQKCLCGYLEGQFLCRPCNKVCGSHHVACDVCGNSRIDSENLLSCTVCIENEKIQPSGMNKICPRSVRCHNCKNYIDHHKPASCGQCNEKYIGVLECIDHPIFCYECGAKIL
jgi:hypothetical protein